MWFRWAERAAGNPGSQSFKHRIGGHTPVISAMQYAARHARTSRVIDGGRWLADTLPRIDSDRAVSGAPAFDVRAALHDAIGSLTDIEFASALLYSGHDLASLDMGRNPKTTVSKLGLDWYQHQVSRAPFSVGRRAARWLAPVIVTVDSIRAAAEKLPASVVGVHDSPRRRLTVQRIADELVDRYPASVLSNNSDAFAHSCALAHHLNLREYLPVATSADVAIAAALAGYQTAYQRLSPTGVVIGIDENVAQMLRAHSLRPHRSLLTAA
ncbi:hypothetical protein MAUB_01140 [Mycolicibacterium aubagnense]|uniref:Uncharacterized protein n=1 Tax=Mycolicibacterium aubagnense TaxID=319707 RepID=A0ABM7I6Q1_9MYCO|nr:hypothetical protein MAUB_01140 [Mycolicibacterium aubagnense]